MVVMYCRRMCSETVDVGTFAPPLLGVGTEVAGTADADGMGVTGAEDAGGGGTPPLPALGSDIVIVAYLYRTMVLESVAAWWLLWGASLETVIDTALAEPMRVRAKTTTSVVSAVAVVVVVLLAGILLGEGWVVASWAIFGYCENVKQRQSHFVEPTFETDT